MTVRSPHEAPAPPPALPVTLREYHGFYRTPRYRRWHSVAALGLFVVGWGAAVLAVTVAAVLFEMLSGGATPQEMADGLLTPSLFLANNLGVALAIPLAVAVHRLVLGQRPGWLFSVQGMFRWGLLGRFLVVAVGIHLVALVCWLVTAGPPDDLEVRPETWALLAIVLLTTPLQAAGEEVAFRGLVTRLVGSWFAAPRVGLLVATAITVTLFVVVHRAEDVVLNVFYACLALAASMLTWRSGGLEAAIALHVTVNLTTMLFVPFLGLEGFFDRESGTGGAQALVQVVALLLTSGALLWQTRRAGVPISAAPGAPVGSSD